MSLKLLNIKKKLEQEELRIKLNKLFSSLPTEVFRKHIIDCLIENNIIAIDTIHPIKQESEEDEYNIDQPEYKEDIISIRNKSQAPVDIPTNTTNIIIDGKTYSIDLVKVSKWTLDTPTKQLKIYKTGIDKIKEVLSNLSFEKLKIMEDRIMENIVALYWNITIYFEKIDFKDFKSKDTKHIYQLLCILYGAINTIDNINRAELFGELLKEYQVTKNSVDFHLVKFKSILKNSFIARLLNTEAAVPEGSNEFDGKLIDELMDILLDEKILPKDLYTFGAIAFYIEQLKGKKIYLTAIQKMLNIENNSKLNKTYSIIVNYTNKNKNFKRKILRRI